MTAILLLLPILLNADEVTKIASGSNDQIEFKKQVVGIWASDDHKSFYAFYDDMEWIHMSEDTKTDGISEIDTIRINKGEYVFGKNAGIFTRRYGNVHWDVEDEKFVDIQTGIGTVYLFLEDQKLINNQEDYRSSWSKLSDDPNTHELAKLLEDNKKSEALTSARNLETLADPDVIRLSKELGRFQEKFLQSSQSAKEWEKLFLRFDQENQKLRKMIEQVDLP